MSSNNNNSNAGTPVILNVYDMSPNNSTYYSMGFGLYHSGLEVHGVEYSFGTEGPFKNEPKQAYGVIYRESINLGSTDKSASEISKLASDVADEFKRQGAYHLLQRNCNHFSRALADKILEKHSFPGWVNRAAGLGNTFSWFIPNSALSGRPVPSGPGQVATTTGATVPAPEKSFTAFTGEGRALGSSPTPTKNNSSGVFSRFGSWTKGSTTTTTTTTTTATVQAAAENPATPTTPTKTAEEIARDRQKILEATQQRLQKNSSV